MSISIFVEGLVICLLIATLGYTYLLNQRLKKLRMDEAAFRATIADLLSATDGAERAVHNLKLSANESSQNLGLRLRDAEKMNAELIDNLEAGDALLSRLVAIVQSAPTTRRPRAVSESRKISELAAEASERINSYRLEA